MSLILHFFLFAFSAHQFFGNSGNKIYVIILLFKTKIFSHFIPKSNLQMVELHLAQRRLRSAPSIHIERYVSNRLAHEAFHECDGSSEFSFPSWRKSNNESNDDNGLFTDRLWKFVWHNCLWQMWVEKLFEKSFN